MGCVCLPDAPDAPQDGLRDSLEAPKWLQNNTWRTQGGLQVAPGRAKRFQDDLKGDSGQPEVAARWLRGSPRCLQDGSRWLNTLPNLPQTPPDIDFGAPRPGFWWLFWQNVDPCLDGFGIIFTMQIPSSLHLIEASKAFSKIEFLKELPICSTIRGKNLAELLYLFNLKFFQVFHVSRSLLIKPTRPSTLQIWPESSPNRLKRNRWNIFWSAFRQFVQV